MPNALIQNKSEDGTHEEKKTKYTKMFVIHMNIRMLYTFDVSAENELYDANRL